MGNWNDACWNWEVSWRTPMELELEVVEELLRFLENFSIKEDAMDKWMWGG